MENKNLFTALVKAQVELKNPSKNKKGGGEKFTYYYTTLDKIIEESKPILAKHGLAIIQTLSGDGTKVGITTRLVHESGESISDTLWLPSVELKAANIVQALGAAITYGRRYSLSAILGISSDEDTDADGININDKESESTETSLNPNRFNPPISSGSTSFPGFPPITSQGITPPAPAPQVPAQNPAPNTQAPVNPAPANKFPAPAKPNFSKPNFSQFIKKNQTT